MRMIIPFLAFWLVATCNAELRTWTAVNGKEVEAEFVSNEKGIVKLKLKSGKVFRVPLDKLSKEDQDFIASISLLRSLKDNIVGKIITLEVQGNKTQTILSINGKVLSGINYDLKDINQTYEIIGNNVKLYAGISATPIVVMSFASSNPKPADKIELKIIDNNASIAGKIIDIESSEKALKSSKYIPPEGALNDDPAAGQLNLRGRLYYKKGSDTPYSGIIYSLYENGQPVFESAIKDGKSHGLYVEWYKNGQKKQELNNKDGKQNGLHVMWYENGQKAAKINYKDGKPDGLAVGWHENGQKAREANFKDGKEISSKLWNSKGEPIDSEEK